MTPLGECIPLTYRPKPGGCVNTIYPEPDQREAIARKIVADGGFILPNDYDDRALDEHDDDVLTVCDQLFG